MTTIEWTNPPGYKGETWNPVTGCTKVSAGCRNCYAEKLAPKVFAGQLVPVIEGDDVVDARPRRFTDIRCHHERLDKPLHWRKRRMVFVNSMSDLFHEDVPDEFIDKVFASMLASPRHVFQVLTKRPERMRDYVTAEFVSNRIVDQWTQSIEPDRGVWSWPGWKDAFRHVWLGVSAENQETADERIPILLDTPTAVRFVSAEPLLGPIDFRFAHRQLKACAEFRPTTDSVANAVARARPGVFCKCSYGRQYHDPLPGEPRLDWVIVGGESGPKARPCDVAWTRSIIEQCKAAGVAVFVKQLGAKPLARSVEDISDETYREIEMSDNYGGEMDGGPLVNGVPMLRQPLVVPLRDRKGGDPNEWPEDLRVREWPQGAIA